MLRPNSQSDFTLCFDASYQCEEEVFSRNGAFPFGNGEEGAGYGAGGVDNGVKVCVVVVVDVGGDAVKEGCVLGVDAAFALVTEEGGLRGTEKWG